MTTRFTRGRKMDFPAIRRKLFCPGGQEGIENRDRWVERHSEIGLGFLNRVQGRK